jgi:hypothetical protein
MVAIVMSALGYGLFAVDEHGHFLPRFGDTGRGQTVTGAATINELPPAFRAMVEDALVRVGQVILWCLLARANSLIVRLPLSQEFISILSSGTAATPHERFIADFLRVGLNSFLNLGAHAAACDIVSEHSNSIANLAAYFSESVVNNDLLGALVCGVVITADALFHTILVRADPQGPDPVTEMQLALWITYMRRAVDDMTAAQRQLFLFWVSGSMALTSSTGGALVIIVFLRNVNPQGVANVRSLNRTRLGAERLGERDWEGLGAVQTCFTTMSIYNASLCPSYAVFYALLIRIIEYTGAMMNSEQERV